MFLHPDAHMFPLYFEPDGREHRVVRRESEPGCLSLRDFPMEQDFQRYSKLIDSEGSDLVIRTGKWEIG